MSIEIRNISKNFGSFKALGDVSLDIESGELVALLVRRAAAKPPCCASLPGWSRLTTAAFTLVVKIPPTCMYASDRWVLCFSITHCFAT